MGIAVIDIVFSDGQLYCSEWLSHYVMANTVIVLVALGITAVNILAKTLLIYISRFESAHIKTSETFSSMLKMFIVSFLNTAVLLLLANLELDIYVFGMPVFAGKYYEFSVDWYRVIGSTICVTMAVNIISPHLANGSYLLYRSFSACLDRGCSCDRRKTRKLIQEDYEEVNTGPEFLFEFRYASTLTTVFMVFMYSSGMPILYPIAFLTFLATYWCDKLFLLCFYKRPVSHTIYLSQRTIKLMNFSMIPHFLLGLYMYSNSRILPSDIDLSYLF